MANLQECHIDKDESFDTECVGDQFKYMLNEDYMNLVMVLVHENICMFYNPSSSSSMAWKNLLQNMA